MFDTFEVRSVEEQSGLKPVSRLAHRDEMTRLRRIRLQLVSQPGHVLIHRAGSDAVAPYFPRI
jgi:hypothetical protein